MSAELASDIDVSKKVGGNKANDHNFVITQFYDIVEDVSVKDSVPADLPVLKDIITAAQNYEDDDEFGKPVYDESIWRHLEHRYKYGMQTYNDWFNSVMLLLKEPKFDIDIKHWYADMDRMDSIIHFYDENDNRLGYFRYVKTYGTFDITNKTTIVFYNDSGTALATFSAILFAGTGKGNAGFRQTVDFSDNTKIQLFADTKSANYSTTHEDHEVLVSHSLNNTKYLISEITNSVCSTSQGESGSFVIHNIANGYDIYGPLDER